MRIPEETVDRIRQAADILEVVGDFVSLKKRGSNYTACCPFHNEKSPSFNVNPTRQIYKCFGCGKAGDAVKFVMDIENIGYGEALRYLAKKYGIEIAEQEQTPEDLLRQNERESLLIILNFAKTFFQETLQTTDEGKSIGLSYFRERGFTNPTIDAFELGYTLDKWDALLQEGTRRGYNRDLLEKAGLILRKETTAGGENKVFDRFRGRVMFPIHNVSGRVIAFGARILKADKTQPKYLNSPETSVYHKSQVLYGIFQAKHAIRHEDVCYLTEGYTDVISLHQAGIKNVVASSGTSLTTEQIRLIARFTPNVTILYDGDAAGIKAALRGLDMVLEEGLNLRLLLLPNGEDPDSYVHKVGAEAFKEYVRNGAKDFIDFKAGQWLTEAGDDPLKRAEGISDVCASITKIPDALKRQTLSQRVAQVFHVSEQTVITEINRLLRKRQEQNKKDVDRQKDRQQTAGSAQANELSMDGSRSGMELDMADINALLAEAGIDKTGSGSPNGTSDVPATLPNAHSSVTRPPISYQEEECIRLLINYGARELEPGITLCHYMLSELSDIDFQTAPFNLILTLFREAYGQGDILTAGDFLNRRSRSSSVSQPEDAEMQHQAIHLTTPRYEISEGWLKHEIHVPSEEEIGILADAAFRNILRIKKILAEQRMAVLQQKLREVSSKTPDEADQLMTEFMHFKRVDMDISLLLGTVISG
jgi:DNA primase